tara:strand:+ start:564 stop:683 length:120 start_codon:yes stop_codon:yes gene_type:complete
MRGCRGMGIVNPKKLPKAMKKGANAKCRKTKVKNRRILW